MYDFENAACGKERTVKNLFVYLLSLGHLFTDLAPGALPAILPFLVLYNGLSYTEVAGLMFASSCFASLVQPLFGYWADKSMKTWFIPLGIAMSGIGLGGAGFFTQYWMIFVAVMFMGVGSSIFHPVAARLVNRVSAHKATGIGIFSVGGNIGFGVAPLIAAAAMTTFQSPGTGVFAVMGIIMAALMLWAIPASLAKLRHQHVSQQLNQCAYNEQKNDWPAFARLSIVILFRSVATTSTLAFIPLFCIQQFGISEAMSSTLLTFLCLCGAFMTAFGGWLTDRVGLIRACRLGYILMAPAFALFLVVPTIWWVFPLLVLVSFTQNGTYAAFVVLGQSYLAKNVGMASGVTMGLASSLGGIFAPALGVVADSYGIDAVMYVLIVIGLCCAAGSLLLIEPKTRS